MAFVINRTLVRDLPGFLRRCRVAAEAHGWEPEFAETSQAEPGLALARQAVGAGARLVFAAGGDGTVRACAQGVARTGIPLAIVPLGTANLTARALGIPARADRAVEAGFRGRDHRVDLASAAGDGIGGDGIGGGGPDGDGAAGIGFTAMAGIGLDAAVV
ncbi:MAG TPA: acylglycerol kinase family protein, partial [Streptosporangiaceae bacterium]|nr:acylglycerol kinase family protein [Streptosporangiaceae bacterium]